MPVVSEIGFEPRQFHPGFTLPSGYTAAVLYQHASQSTEVVVEINYRLFLGRSTIEPPLC